MNRNLRLAIAALAGSLVTSVHAAPIELFNGEPTKFKFTNYENWYDMNANGIIDTGDKFEGILKISTLTNQFDSADKNAQLLTKEVTGHFLVSVSGGMIAPGIGGTGVIDFTLGASDFINFYVGTGATKNYAPEAGTLAAAIGTATDGVLWASILGSDYIEGDNDTTGSFPASNSVNHNWADFTVNNTDYKFVPLLWPEYVNGLGSGLHDTSTGTHFSGHASEVYFETKLSFNNNPNAGYFMFKSEDPGYLYAIPEPFTVGLLGLGLVGMGALRRRQERTK